MAGPPPESPGPEEADPASPIYSLPVAEDQLHQGEILRDIWEWVAEYDETGAVVGARPKRHPLAVLLTQECDLAQDFRVRKEELRAETDLKSLLFCPAWKADDLRNQRDDIDSKFWKIVRQNKAERYHYLAEVVAASDARGEGYDPMLVDFKSFFSVRTIEVYRQLRNDAEDSAASFCVLGCPWREHLQGRFASYLARVGLPLDHFVPVNRRPALPAAAP